MSMRRWGLALLVVAGLATMAAAVSEYQVKAAFIKNLVKFVERPGGGKGPWSICVIGEDPFGEALDAIEGDAGGTSITVRRIKGVTEGRDCQVLFIAGSEKARLRGILDGLAGAKVMTVGDTDGYAQAGVVMNFYIEASKVRFEINPEAASKAGLNISSKLMSLARIVR